MGNENFLCAIRTNTFEVISQLYFSACRQGCHLYKISKFPDLSPFFPDQSNIQQLRNVLIRMNIFLNYHLCACLYMFQRANFCEK